MDLGGHEKNQGSGFTAVTVTFKKGNKKGGNNTYTMNTQHEVSMNTDPLTQK